MVLESQSSALWFQAVWGLTAGAQPEVTILHRARGPGSYKKTQRYVADCFAHPPRGNQDPVHHCGIVS